MNLQRHLTEIFLIDTDNGKEYVVKFIDFENPAYGHSVIIMQKITTDKKGFDWQLVQATDTMKTPGYIAAMNLVKKALQ